jgi:hypothetical protein
MARVDEDVRTVAIQCVGEDIAIAVVALALPYVTI